MEEIGIRRAQELWCFELKGIWRNIFYLSFAFCSKIQTVFPAGMHFHGKSAVFGKFLFLDGKFWAKIEETKAAAIFCIVLFGVFYSSLELAVF